MLYDELSLVGLPTRLLAAADFGHHQSSMLVVRLLDTHEAGASIWIYHFVSIRRSIIRHTPALDFSWQPKHALGLDFSSCTNGIHTFSSPAPRILDRALCPKRFIVSLSGVVSCTSIIGTCDSGCPVPPIFVGRLDFGFCDSNPVTSQHYCSTMCTMIND